MVVAVRCAYGCFCGWFECTYSFKVVRMVVIRLYVRHGSLVLGVIRRKLCNGDVTIVGVCVKMSAF